MAENKSPKTFDAGAAVGKYRLVKFDANMDVVHNTATATDDPVGVTRNGAASGDPVAVSLVNEPGTLEMTAAGAIDAGADAYAADAGKIQALPEAAGTYRKIGVAITAASADESVIEVLPYDYHATETVSG